MKRSAPGEDGAITYELVRKRVQNINLRVRRDGTIAVSAPYGEPLDRIEGFVRSKEEWIRACLLRRRERAEREESRRPRAGGGGILLSGREYPLLIRPAGETRPRAEWDGSALTLYVGDPAGTDWEPLLDRWRRDRCRELFAESLDRLYPRFERKGVPRPELRVRAMKSRWGSCVPARRRVTLNLRLLEAPRLCVDAVMAHELTHFLYLDHSPAFYAVLRELMPEYEEARRLLRKL